MIPYLFSSILWATLIGLDLFLARKLFLLYKKDNDIRKLIFTIGLLMCMPVYALAIAGINSFPMAMNIYSWSPLPILLAFIFNLLNDRFSLDLKKFYRFFLFATAVTFVLFFAPLTISSLPILLTGLTFAIVLAVLQNLRKTDISSVMLLLSMPCFAICLYGISLNLVELSIFAGLAAKVSMLLAFEVAKKQEGVGSSILVLTKKLVSAEENFSKLLALLPDAAVIVDEKGNFIAINQNVTAMTGYQKEELIGTNFVTADFITAHSKAILLKNLAKRMLGFHVEPYEMELKAKDGKKLQFQLNAMKIEHEGKPADLVIFRDFTERNKLLQSLEAEQQRFQSIAESSGEWIWELNTNGQYIYSNPGVEKILGYHAEEIIGKKYDDLLIQNSMSENNTSFKTLTTKKETFNTIRQCLHKDKHISIVETHAVPIFDANKEFVGYRGVDRDITERQKAAEELQNNRNYLKTVLNVMLSGVVILDGKTHKIVDANETALKMIGATREEVLGRECHGFICPAEKGVCPITDLGLTVDRSEKALLRANGSQISILKSVSRVESNGRSLLVENLVDISERKEMEERLLKSEKFAAIGQLATIVAHDLRNPLQAMAAAVHFLKKSRQKEEDSRVALAIQHIEDAVKYSDKTINNLLDYSEDMKLELTETDPRSIVRQALSGIVIPKKVEIVENTLQTPKINVDLDKIKRVVVNIVSNAFDAMNNEGTLTIVSRENNAFLELSFSDTGCGISKEKMDRLWSPFVTTKARGMGLGLPICKRIIEAHGGHILVETQIDKGTSFTLIFPIHCPNKEMGPNLFVDRAIETDVNLIESPSDLALFR